MAMTSRVANAAVGASIATEIGELRRHGSPGGVDLVLELLNCLTVVAREVDLEALGVAAAAFDEDKVGPLVLAAPAQVWRVGRGDVEFFAARVDAALAVRVAPLLPHLVVLMVKGSRISSFHVFTLRLKRKFLRGGSSPALPASLRSRMRMIILPVWPWVSTAITQVRPAETSIESTFFM
eukprot:CAMPEP_0179987014 /NCGR_PEP_ID=MMETSP0984-20121128/2550_1 /TAXON_ID=483367 /ORGANISM="non described non described, Strain CCMP 2436" /LENGTH=179 /DNA_ID=CAMNT_0021905859 /DNA_START=4728 /DNA_END=5267 /DNA_ORIENTATION=-